MKAALTLFNGRTIDLFDFKEEDVDIKVIAHGLACVNRFAGQTKRPITVAQHSVYVSRLCYGTKHALQALLHDASEAYIGDMTKWLKECMPEFCQLERKIEETIYRKFGCNASVHPTIVEADNMMVRFEGRQPAGHGPGFLDWHPNYPPLTADEILRIGPWHPWTWKQAEESFLDHFRLLERQNHG